MDLLSLRLVLRIAELENVSAAARDLSLSPASASARLSKLEEEIGFRLFNRTTRSISLTTDGIAFLPYAQQSLETLDVGLSLASGQGSETKGTLRMAMPGSFGRMHIIPALPDFRSRFPLVDLDLRLSDQILDVVEGAFDLVIRNADLADSSFIARKLAVDERILIASVEYLEMYGEPKTIEDLQQHKFVGFGSDNKLHFQKGVVLDLPKSLIVNDGEAMRLMIEGGMGIGKKSIWNAYEGLQSGKLVRVLPDFPLITDSAIWALYPSGGVVSPKVRAMIDFLLERFQPAPWTS